MEMFVLILCCLALIFYAYHEVGVMNRIETLEGQIKELIGQEE